MNADPERRMILEMIESGKISAEEGMELLKALADAQEPDAQTPAELPPPQEDQANPGVLEPEMLPGPEPTSKASLPPNAERWRSWWVYPFWAGMGIMILGSWLMYWVQSKAGVGFWFLCSWVPFLLGVALVAIAWQSRTAHWLHLRVHQQPGEWPRNIAISFPLPIRFATWLFHTFGNSIPVTERDTVEHVLRAVDSSTSPENPVYIEVDEGEGGEQVEIYIG